jgi:hypothetical protein
MPVVGGLGMRDTEVGRRVRRFLALTLDDIDTVRVDVEQGVVYLEGVAGSASNRQRIQQMVARMPGVQRVINCLSLEHVAELRPCLETRVVEGPLPAASELPGGRDHLSLN